MIQRKQVLNIKMLKSNLNVDRLLVLHKATTNRMEKSSLFYSTLAVLAYLLSSLYKLYNQLINA